MRSALRTLILIPAILCATAALASDKAVVNVPFSFETHGQSFPAGKYAVALDLNATILTMRNVQDPKESMAWAVSPADASSPAVLSMKFDGTGDAHSLRSVQFGTRTTSVLDAPAVSHNAGSDVAAASGQ